MDKQITSISLAEAPKQSLVQACCEVDHSKHEEFVDQTDVWDKLGIALSGICAVHCLVTPFLILAVPALGETFEQPWVHLLMAVFILPIGLFAFWSGHKHHKENHVFGMGVAGLALVTCGLLAPHEWVEFFGYDLVTIVGGAFLIVAHVLNRRACHCHSHDHKPGGVHAN